jgi:hypothetical protein
VRALVLASLFFAGGARARTELTPQEADRTPAVRYARLDRAACEAELVRRHIPFQRVAEARGVLAPVRLAGPLHGVTWRTEVPASMRPTPYEIFDCRLVLAVDDFSAILAREGVVEAIHYSAYRPPSKTWKGTIGARHDGGLAIDAGRFLRHDGSVLHVEKDFHGRIGAETCAAGPSPASAMHASAVVLHRIVCDASAKKLFHVLLTPNNDWAHRNHFHLEVTAGARWFILH